MTLLEYDNIVQNERDPTFGILKTSISHHQDKEGGSSIPNCHTVTNGKEKDNDWKMEHPNSATRRDIYYQFKIQRGVSLAEHGVAVVYDNNSPKHVTLVRTKRGSLGREWDYYPRPHCVYLPT